MTLQDASAIDVGHGDLIAFIVSIGEDDVGFALHDCSDAVA